MKPHVALLAAYALFVVYGSLVPLDFKALPLDEAVRQFGAIAYLQLGAESRADWIANGVLYLPLGLLLARVLRGTFPGVLGALLAWLACTALAVAVEFAQLWFPPRTVSQNDILAETLGSAVGVLLAPVAAGRARRLLAALRQHGAEWLPHGLEAYAVALLAFSFFPYDFVLSGQELAEKAASGQWGLWWAREAGSPVVSSLKWLAEVVMAMPLGLWWAIRRRPGRAGPVGLLAAGAVFGALIEIGQFFVFSGVSEGASVVSRALGVLLGGTLLSRLVAGGATAIRAAVLRLAPLAAPPYLLLLLVANGWFRASWQGMNAAAAVWRDVHLLPFYYHYFTSEAAALYSLASVTLMYAPLALLGWARRWSVRTAMFGSGALALVVETSKLFLGGMRPDPTNVLIAAATVGGALACVDSLARSRLIAQSEASRPVATASVAARGALGLASAVAAVLASTTLPGVGAGVFVVVAAAAALVATWPASALWIVLGALPVLDLAPWTNRLWFDEWTLLVIACVGMAWWRLPASQEAAPPRSILGRAPLALVGVSLFIATLRSLARWWGSGDGGLENPMSAVTALWVLEGAVAAWLVLALARRIDAEARRAAVVGGMVAALALTVAVVLWERVAFVGLFDFDSDYRVTGPFSAMHRGGAYLECFLVVGAAFVLGWLLHARSLVQRAAAAGLLALDAYAVMVTYSRNGYVALAVVVVLAALLLQPRAASARWRPAAKGAAVALLVAAIAIPIGWGGYARQRIGHSVIDLRIRLDHWIDAASLHDGSVFSTLFGMGLARFPELHHWHSQEPLHAPDVRWLRDEGGAFLRLGPGAPTYFEQWVSGPLAGPLAVRMQLRTAAGDPSLEMALCEKWLLTSASCSAMTLGGAGPGAWRAVQGTLEVPSRHPLRPLKFSLFTPREGAAIDVRAVSVTTADGRELIANGDFAQGLARWFWATDIDPPWHIHSMPVALWFEMGWFGIVAFATAVVAAAISALRRWQGRQWLAPTALVALAGMLTSGLVNTLVDVPRFLFLLLVLIGLCRADDPRETARSPA